MIKIQSLLLEYQDCWAPTQARKRETLKEKLKEKLKLKGKLKGTLKGKLKGTLKKLEELKENKL